MDARAVRDERTADPRSRTRRMGLVLGLVALALLLGPIVLKSWL